jgi:hypothetical protein
MPSYILQTEFIFLMMLCLMSLFFLSLKPRLTPHYLHHSLYHSILTNLLMLHMHLPSLLANHGAGRGARLELLDDRDAWC